jgi:tyrosinase
LRTATDIAETEAHNAKFPDHDENVKILNDNVVAWLNSNPFGDGKPTGYDFEKYKESMYAPNYTYYSNLTSAKTWNATFDTVDDNCVSIEDPHNNIHLAVGGFSYGGSHFSPIEGANGDMGENECAAFDPIFFFHHCHIDRMFWLWQVRNN